MKAALALLATALLTQAAHANTCKTLIMAIEGDQPSLKTYQIEVKTNGVTAIKEMLNTIQTTALECGKSHTAYVRLMEKNDKGKYTNVVKTKTRTFIATESSRILVNME